MTDKVFSNILVAYDDTDDTNGALDEAVELAAICQANVHLVAVAHLSTGELLAQTAYPTDMRSGQEDAVRKSLEIAGEAFKQRGCGVKTSFIVDSDPAAVIRALAIKTKANLIILGHRHQGLIGRLWNGSVGMTVLAHAPCSILVAVGHRLPNLQT